MRWLNLILLNLYVAWCCDTDLKIAVSRNNNDYRPKNRYNEQHITRCTINVVDDLVAAGLINSRNGYPAHDKKPGRVSRIWPTHVLIEQFKAAHFTPFDISDSEDRETIILRDMDKNEIEYEDDENTERMHPKHTPTRGN